MKRFLLFSLILSCCISNIEAQIVTKTETVCKRWEGERGSVCRHLDYLMAVAIVYDKNMSPLRYQFELAAQYSSYDCMEDLFVVKNGSAQEIYDFLCEIEHFSQTVKEDGISANNGDYVFKRWNFGWLLGKRVVVEYDGKYHSFKDKHIRKIKSKLVDYCERRNIELNVH